MYVTLACDDRANLDAALVERLNADSLCLETLRLALMLECGAGRVSKVKYHACTHPSAPKYHGALAMYCGMGGLMSLLLLF